MEHQRLSWFLLFLLSPFINCTHCFQDGFLSLTCGGITNYVDSSNISWTPDGYYTDTGTTASVTFLHGSSSTTLPIRVFPDSSRRNCYRLPLSKSSSSSPILIRAKFVYKNYDGQNKAPVFSVSLATAVATTVNLGHVDPWIEEFIWPANVKDVLPLCFNSINGGFPVVSSVEIRPQPEGAYAVVSNDKVLKKSFRINCGYNDGPLRYPLDPYDRIWDADEDFSPYHVSSSFNTQSDFSSSNIKESPPNAVLQTGRVLARRNNLIYSPPLNNNNEADYHVTLYFAGILPVAPTFDVLINGEIVWSSFRVMRWEASSLSFTLKGITTLNITLRAVTYYPLVNALEVYEILDIPLESSSTTVSALQVIQKSIGMDFEWQDDPCSPTPWKHIGCEGNLVTSMELSDIELRTISPTFGDLLDLKSLDLHNTSLAGEIQNLGSLQHLQKLNLSCNYLTSFGSELEDLINIQILDLQNNSLKGTVPESLGELRDLQLLNLENNKLQGPLPQSLNRENLDLRTTGNLCLSFSLSTCNELIRNPSLETPQVTIFTPRKRKNHSHLAILLGSVGGAVLILAVVSFYAILYFKRKKSANACLPKSEMDIRRWGSARIFTYKEIKGITNNYKEAIGRGSFGCVYVGTLSGRLVAVKVRFDKTQLGDDAFINEVSLLSQIRHQNLVTLEGFCYESKQQILVYEYLPGGSLADNLHGANSKKLRLSWVRRLKIAIDAAKGLEYLHNGNDMRIIHRDVKSSNILLDKEMNAKVCDFGLSKQVTQLDASHVTTVVKGTAGYLDPEYYSTQQLTEKSDIYSFGVVLLELICGREPLTHTGCPDSFNLVLWAKPYLQAGGFEVVDDCIKESFDQESMKRASVIACRSVERDASCRPTISEVLVELKQAYSLQLAYLASSGLVN